MLKQVKQVFVAFKCLTFPLYLNGRELTEQILHSYHSVHSTMFLFKILEALN